VPRLREEDEPPRQVPAAVERRRQDDRLLQEQPVGLQEREVPVFRLSAIRSRMIPEVSPGPGRARIAPSLRDRLAPGPPLTLSVPLA
jgi:hypothetical protein